MAIVAELPSVDLNVPYTQQIKWLEDIVIAIREYIEADQSSSDSTHTNTTIAYALLYYVESLVFSCQRCERERIKFPFANCLDFQKVVAADINNKFLPYIKLPAVGAFSSGGKLFKIITKKVLSGAAVDLNVEQLSLNACLEIWKDYAVWEKQGIDDLRSIITPIQTISNRNDSIIRFFHFILCLCWIENYSPKIEESIKAQLACQAYIQKRIAELSMRRHVESSLDTEIERFAIEQSHWWKKGKEKNAYALGKTLGVVSQEGGYMGCMKQIELFTQYAATKHASIIQFAVFLHYILDHYINVIIPSYDRLVASNQIAVIDYKSNYIIAVEIKVRIQEFLNEKPKENIERDWLLYVINQINEIIAQKQGKKIGFEFDSLLSDYLQACVIGIFPNYYKDIKIFSMKKVFTGYPSSRIYSVDSSLMYKIALAPIGQKKAKTSVQIGDNHPLLKAKKLALSLTTQDYFNEKYANIREEGNKICSQQIKNSPTLFIEAQRQKFLSYILIAELKTNFAKWMNMQIAKLKNPVEASIGVNTAELEKFVDDILVHAKELGTEDRRKLIQQLLFIYHSSINSLVFQFESITAIEFQQRKENCTALQILIVNLSTMLQTKFSSIINEQEIKYFMQHKISQLQNNLANVSTCKSDLFEMFTDGSGNLLTAFKEFYWLNTTQQMDALQALMICGLSYEEAIPRVAGLANAELVFLKELIATKRANIRYFFPERWPWFYNVAARTTLLRMLQVDQKLNMEEAFYLLNNLRGDELKSWSQFVTDDKFLHLNGKLNIKDLFVVYDEYKHKEGRVFLNPDTFNCIWHLSFDVGLEAKDIIKCLYMYLDVEKKQTRVNYNLVCEVAARFKQDAKNIIMQNDYNSAFSLIADGPDLLQIAKDNDLNIQAAMQNLMESRANGCVIS